MQVHEHGMFKMVIKEYENQKKDLTENQKMICQAISTTLISVGKVVIAIVIVLGAAILGAASIAISLGASRKSEHSWLAIVV